MTDSDDEDDSPSVRAMNKREGLSTTSKLNADDARATTAGSVPSLSQVGKTWPAYTDLIYSASGEVGILAQSDEVKVTVRKAIYFIEEFIIFDNAFPDLATRAAWARKALLKAVNHLSQSGSRLRDYECYLFLKKRLKEDPEYVKALSSVVRENCSSDWI